MEIVIGRTNTGKTEYILEKVKEDIQDNKKVILIVPEQYTLRAEQNIIEKTNSVGIMNIEVLSFRRLAEILRGKVKGKNRNLIDDTGMYILASRATEENKSNFEVFKTSYNKRGFLDSIVEVVNSFKKNCISPEELDEYIKNSEGTILNKKLGDINSVYTTMCEYMKNSFLDDNDMMQLLKENIASSDFLSDKHVYIDSFNTFSNIEYEVIDEIIKGSLELTISINTMDDKHKSDFSVFEPTVETLNRINELGILNNRKVKLIRLENCYIDNKYLKHLENNLFAYPAKTLNGVPDSIEIYSYLNRNQEIEGIAIEIMKLAIEKDVRWNEVLVVSNNMEVYQSCIKRVFSEYSIPYFLDEVRDISSHALMVFVLNIFKSISSNFRYEEVYKMLKTGFSWLSEDEVEVLENYSLQYKIQGNKYFDDFEKGLDEYKDINEIRKKFIEIMQPVKLFMKSNKTIKEVNIFLFDLLVKLDIKQKIDDLIEEQRIYERFDIADETAQVWNILLDIMNQMTEIMGDTKVNSAEYSKLLESGLSNYKVGVIPSTLDQVMFGNLDRTKSGNIKYLFVIGVNDGILPSNIEDTGILLDEDRDSMKEKGLDMNMGSEKVIKNENFNIYSSFTKPSKKLILSFSNSNNSGASMRPSTLIDRIKYIFPEIIIKGDMDLDNNKRIEKIISKAPSIKYIIESFRDNIEGEEIIGEWFNVYSWYLNEKDSKNYENIVYGLFDLDDKEYIEKEYARKLYGLPIRSSVSRIEKFKSCPFSHFMTYGLKPRERKKSIINYPDIGNILHTALEEYGKEVENLGRSWIDLRREESDKIVDSIIDKMTENFNSGIFRLSHRYKYLINKLKRVSRKSVYNATNQLRAGEFTPKDYEFEFGFSESVPPMIIEFEDGGTIELVGKIDRVDIYEGEEESYVKIIDYKSGNMDFKLEKALQGLQIQLVLYLDAVIQNSELLVKNELYPAGAFYFKLKDPITNIERLDEREIEKKLSKEMKLSGFMLRDLEIIKLLEKDLESQSSIYPVRMTSKGTKIGKSGDVYDFEDIELITTYVKKIIKESAIEIMKGNVKVEPYNDNNTTPCDYCEYDSICKFDISLDGKRYNKLERKTLDTVRKELSEDEVD